MALITIILVVIRLFVINVYASFAAPIMAEETLKTILIEGLVAGGSDYSKDDLEAWELDDLENEFEIQMTTNSNFNVKKVLPVFFDINDPGLGYNEDAAAFDKMADQELSDWLSGLLSGSLGENIYDNLHPTYVGPDLEGGVAMLKLKNNDGSYYVYYGNTNGELYHNSSTSTAVYLKTYCEEFYDRDGILIHSTNANSSVTTEYDKSCVSIYGSWKWREDGTQVDTDDEIIPAIGEADGTQVTPDMLNPDGTVTIGGITYYPKDFIDWDKFKDPAIIDLLNKILAKIDDIPVISEQDKPLVDVDEIEVSVPEELSDYAAPIGISNVFPFCIPWDIVRGFQILNQPSVTPKFEIPFNIPEFGLFDGVEETITIDFTEYDKYVQIFRWFQIVGFSFLLCKLSLTRVKGAGA